MIVPDVNLLVYAYNSGARQHTEARRWWEGLMDGEEPVGLPWVVSCGFVRLMTHPRVLDRPMSAADAVERLAEWFDVPHVRAISPGSQHIEIFRRLVEAVGTGGNLVTDVHIAAMAIEHQAELHSNDSDFARMPGLRWRQPL